MVKRQVERGRSGERPVAATSARGGTAGKRSPAAADPQAGDEAAGKRRPSTANAQAGDEAAGKRRPSAANAQASDEAQAALSRLRAEGHELASVAPNEVKGRAIATSFWGRAWCLNLERYSYYASRLPAGRTYLRRGHVLDLRMMPGRLTAMVLGEGVHEVNVRIDLCSDDHWQRLRERCVGQVDSLLALLRGELSTSVMALVTDPELGLFPAPEHLHCGCTCIDDADLCKHVAAALYGAAVRLDEQPALLFLLRGVDHRLLVSEAAAPVEPGAASLELPEADLAALFDLSMDDDANG